MIVSACVRFYTKSEVNRYGDVEITTPSDCYEIPCHRHADAFYIISQFVNRDELDKKKTEQGFLTDWDEFLDRYKAMDEAIRCGQLPPEAKEKCAELYSEDLW
jgi:hypothetical protein